MELRNFEVFCRPKFQQVLSSSQGPGSLLGRGREDSDPHLQEHAASSLYVGTNNREVKAQWVRNQRHYVKIFMLWEVKDGRFGLKIKASVIKKHD